MRDTDSQLVEWVYTLDGLGRTDEALRFLEDNPSRIGVWLDERRTLGRLFTGKFQLCLKLVGRRQENDPGRKERTVRV